MQTVPDFLVPILKILTDFEAKRREINDRHNAEQQPKTQMNHERK